jgi:hypothetical protein
MKRIVRRELEKEGYAVVEEPRHPAGRLSWMRYRPDLLGYRPSSWREDLALVECETRPGAKKLDKKNYSSVVLQSRLTRPASVRRILAVPQGNLGRVGMDVRGRWEVWTIGSASPVLKLPRQRIRFSDSENVATN